MSKEIEAAKALIEAKRRVAAGEYITYSEWFGAQQAFHEAITPEYILSIETPVDLGAIARDKESTPSPKAVAYEDIPAFSRVMRQGSPHTYTVWTANPNGTYELRRATLGGDYLYVPSVPRDELRVVE